MPNSPLHSAFVGSFRQAENNGDRSKKGIELFSPRYIVDFGDKKEEVGVEFLSSCAKQYKLERYASGRYSWYLVLQIFMYRRQFGIEPIEIVEAIKELECFQSQHQTKSESQFKHNPLKGFWYKHYFSGRFLAHNLKNYHGKNGIRKVIESNWLKTEPLTRDVMWNIINDLNIYSLQKRLNEGRLTGEWIVFAKHKNQNYYLALGEHDRGDLFLYESIRSTCLPQFKFLEGIVNNNL